MMTLQEIDDILAEFQKVDYQNFTLETLRPIATKFNWEVMWPDDEDYEAYIHCEFPSTPDCWAGGYFEAGAITWFFIVLYLWEEPSEDDFDTTEQYKKQYALERKKFDSHYKTLNEHLRSVLGEPLSSITQTRKDYRQAAWLLTNGVMYLYQGERDIQFGIEIGLFFMPWDHKSPIQELKFGV